MGQRNGNRHSNLREFGEFRLDTQKCVLWHLDQPVDLQPKEIELLSVLTESPGEVVTKGELMERVWADSFVEESNLPRHIYRLRRAFEEHGLDGKVIQTVPRRGYRFTAEIETAEADYLIERHSISRTLIEEIHSSDEPGASIKTSGIVSNSLLTYVLVGLITVSVVTVAFALISSDFVPIHDGTIKSIAVLPFRAPDAANERALGLGFADALGTKLAGLSNVRVLSPHTTIGYVDEKLDPVSVGKELGVEAVVDGILQNANGSLRATVRLTRIKDGQLIWSGSYEGSDQDIFGLQDNISLQAPEAIATNLNLRRRETAFSRYTENSDAYQAYLTGRSLHYQNEFPKAILEFERAIKLDAKYVPALVGLADANAVLANSKSGEERILYFERAKSIALQALALDPNLAEAHASIGWIRRTYDWDWEESEKHLKKAIELDPTSSQAYQRLSLLYITLGRTGEALEFGRKAKQLNPVNHSFAWALFCDRQFAKSAAEYDRRMTISSAPNVISESRLGKAMGLLGSGKNIEALEVLGGFTATEQKQFRVAVIHAIAMFNAGERNRSAALMAELEDLAAASPGRWVRLAYVYASIGENEKALSALEKGLSERDDRLLWLKTTPYFDELRNEPRFKHIVSQMRLPD